MIRFKNISFSYHPQKPILQNFSIDLPINKIIGIAGLNGVGKSTLFKLLLGILSPKSGEIEYPFCRNDGIFGYVSALEPIAFHFTVRDIVEMGYFPHQKKGRVNASKKESISTILHKTDLYHFQNRYFNTLSSGEQQRVHLARIMGQNPAVLLLDEPFAHLDIAQTEKMIQLLSTWQAETQKGILIISHHLKILEQFTHDLIILKNGTTLFYGQTKQVLTPQNIQMAFDTETPFYY